MKSSQTEMQKLTTALTLTLLVGFALGWTSCWFTAALPRIKAAKEKVEVGYNHGAGRPLSIAEVPDGEYAIATSAISDEAINLIAFVDDGVTLGWRFIQVKEDEIANEVPNEVPRVPQAIEIKKEGKIAFLK